MLDDKYIKVVSIEANPEAIIEKGKRDYKSTALYILEDGRKLTYPIYGRTQKELKQKMSEYPIVNICNTKANVEDNIIIGLQKVFSLM